MKKLYLVRHAKSSWESPEMTDFDRPLNDRGIKDAPRMGRLLKKREVVPNRMITSPAMRALSTCNAFARALKFDPAKIEKIQKLYHAGSDTWLEILRSLKEVNRDETLIVFGHNPGITEFVNILLSQSIDNIPTCGIVAGSLDIVKWKDISPGCGIMESFDYPKMGD